MNKEEELKCSSCGMPSEIAEKAGFKLVLTSDGSVVCPICKDMLPLLKDEVISKVSKRSADFAVYIDSSACMFGLDELSVLCAVQEIMFSVINRIIEHNPELALTIMKSTTEFNEEKIKKILDTTNAKLKDERSKKE